MQSIAQLSAKGDTFHERYLKKLWKGVKEDFWGDLKKEQQQMVKALLEGSMEEEIKELIGSNPWEHNLNRTGYRNGHYLRSLITSIGEIRDLRVPRVREGGVEFKAIEKYQQRTREVDRLIKEIFLQGVSTRRVEEVLEPLLCKDAVSPTTVSNITKALNREVFKYHNRKIKDEYHYLILDGIYIGTKSPLYKKRRCILVCYGIKGDKKKELIDFEMTKKGESQIAWENFLNRLYHRGLEGKPLKMASIDGNKGLYNAIQTVYPNVPIQRCWAHKLRNVANKCPRKIQEEVIKGARKIYNQDNKDKALQSYKEWHKEWENRVPEAVQCLEDDIDDLLNFYEQPKEYWKKLRTTNAIERVFREVRRRTRPMSCFQNRESVERIIFAIFHRQNKIWGNSLI